MGDRKKIVFLARWYPHRYDSMYGLFIQRHAEAVSAFHDICVVYVHADENAKEKFEIERQCENNVDTIRIYYRKNNNKIINIIRFFRANRKALSLIDRIDIIHVHILTRLGVIALFEKKLHHIPYLITEHWSRYLPGNDFNGVIRKFVTRKVVKEAAMITTVTKNLGNAMKNHKLLNDNYKILPNVVDTNMFVPSKHDNKTVKIIHISCFENKSKNISGLLDALKIIKDSDIDFLCEMIGDGMDFEVMKEYCKQLGLNGNVIFKGLLEGNELASALSQGDFLVLSSNYENLPVVILEALSCGIPVVSTNVGGIHEVINNENGILVKPNDNRNLAEAIMTMMNKCHTYEPETLRAPILEHYSTTKVGLLLFHYYNEIKS